jgi:hypothetical protein
MNNFNKLIVKNLRNKYLRYPTVKDIDIGKIEEGAYIDYYYITVQIYIGVQINYINLRFKTVLKRDQAYNAITSLRNKFQQNKSESNLQSLYTAMNLFREKDEEFSIKHDYNYTSLFSLGMRKGLVTKEGVTYLLQIKEKLQVIENNFQKAFEDIDNLKEDMMFFNPSVRSVYDRYNKHTSWIAVLKEQIDSIIKVNTKE